MQILCKRNISLTGQCKTQTTDYYFHQQMSTGQQQFHCFLTLKTIIRSQSAVCIYCPFLLLESYPSTLTKTSIKKSKRIGHLHDGVILLTMTLILQGLLSCANQGFCYLNLTGIMDKYEKKAQKNSGRSSKVTPS